MPAVIFPPTERTARVAFDYIAAILERPAFKGNHTLMMRHGEAGLRTFLAGLRLGRQLPPEL